ncbi:MAG: hypothetical protein KJ882_02430 [Proteobacteria bacterium]|nr:hypothetical protein [Pseudomonadota bacterium]MBU4009598.1 hypothetical protein [Pseudomonadota bacterium]
MKQKYIILKDDENKKLIISEFAELDKEIFSLLCEETYENTSIMNAISEGKTELIATIRTHNFFPPILQADKIAEAIMVLEDSQSIQSTEVFIDDANHLAKEIIELLDDEPIDGEPEELDEVFDESFDEKYDGKTPITGRKPSISIADDEFVESDEEL